MKNKILFIIVLILLIGCDSNEPVKFAVETFEEPFEGCNEFSCNYPIIEEDIMRKCKEKGYDGFHAVNTADPMWFTCVKRLD